MKTLLYLCLYLKVTVLFTKKYRYLGMGVGVGEWGGGWLLILILPNFHLEF